MAISFIRVDDRIIHGQIIIRWSTEYPCDGIIAVDDKAASSEVIRNALLAASTKKTFIWTREKFKAKMEEAAASSKNYFVITKTLNIGPQSAKKDTVRVSKNADITKEDIAAYEKIHSAGYQIEFQLVPDFSKVRWSDVREKLI